MGFSSFLCPMGPDPCPHSPGLLLPFWSFFPSKPLYWFPLLASECPQAQSFPLLHLLFQLHSTPGQSHPVSSTCRWLPSLSLPVHACMLSHFSRVQPFGTLWTVTHQAPLSMGFSRKEYWSGLPCTPPGDLPDAGIEPTSLMSPALAGRFFTISTTCEALTLPHHSPNPQLCIQLPTGHLHLHIVQEPTRPPQCTFLLTCDLSHCFSLHHSSQ